MLITDHELIAVCHMTIAFLCAVGVTMSLMRIIRLEHITCGPLITVAISVGITLLISHLVTNMHTDLYDRYNLLRYELIYIILTSTVCSVLWLVRLYITDIREEEIELINPITSGE